MKKETVEIAEPQQPAPRIEEVGEPEPDPLQEKQTKDIAALQRQAHATMTSLTELRIQVAEMERMAKEKPPVPEASRPEGIYGVMIADIYCPDCGLKLDGNSATGPKFQYYVHPFAPSPRLGGDQCKLRGRKFLAPKMFLPMVP